MLKNTIESTGECSCERKVEIEFKGLLTNQENGLLKRECSVELHEMHSNKHVDWE